KIMDTGESPLPDSINPNNFPAKLWRLVNNPANKAIYWDSLGECIVIDDGASSSSSFVRQLNLYGFRKADPPMKDNYYGDGVTHHHFHNPNFKRGCPELVASLRRLTVDNKAKLQAGLKVTCRPPSRYQRFSGGDGGRGNSSSLLSPARQESTHPYYPNKAQATAVHNGTPVPPRYLIRGHGAALSPTVFAPDKGMPVSLSHHYAGVASGANVAHIQKGLLTLANHGNPNFTGFSPPKAQFQPGFYSPVCQCYTPNLVASHMTGGGLQTGSFPPLSYYQATYPVNMFCCGDHNQALHNHENQEPKKCDVNLDAIFQIADEVMQTPPSSCLVKVATLEKPGPALALSSSISNSSLCQSPASTVEADPLCVGPIITAVSGKTDGVEYGQEEQSVVSVPEQMPDDDIFEITSDDAEDSEVTCVEVSNTLRDTSSSCTGSTLHP
ncbi:hypothetical protein L3Q82_022058, partial [Scortum barcoo]